MPTDLLPGLALSAVLEREDPRDCLVSRFGEQLLELPRGAVVGTSSLRRQAQIRAAKKGLRVEDLRGNLDTRPARSRGATWTPPWWLTRACGAWAARRKCRR
ncbi:MAG: hypothetical protein IPJ35_11320 [Elusimicrobia bacterium]|nr:hypothetical protein [Elusimicrobiota bacterium]